MASVGARILKALYVASAVASAIDTGLDHKAELPYRTVLARIKRGAGSCARAIAYRFQHKQRPSRSWILCSPNLISSVPDQTPLHFIAPDEAGRLCEYNSTGFKLQLLWKRIQERQKFVSRAS